MTVPLIIQPDSDQSVTIDEPVVFGLAVTLAMPGEITLYDEVRARIVQRAAVSP